ncbi:MAG: heme synthase [Homoserinimonas sp.]|nr:heme synthase [Homoserinimonas sp.]
MKGLSISVRRTASRFYHRLPSSLERRTRILAWLSLVAQILIVGTGGAVRLTGSGLGCPTWPRCTEDSFVALPEQGIHGVIEFGNRLLTVVLIAIALAMFLHVLRLRQERRDLFALSLALGLGIPFQGVIGGITVLTNLNPYVVGLHFVLSTILVVLATILVWRVYNGNAQRHTIAPGWLVTVTIAACAFVGITVLVGVLTTGSGPHAGDHGAARNNLNPELLQHVHSWPAYITLILTLAIVASALILRLRKTLFFAGGLLVVEGLQIVVGIAQSRLGLPELLVASHMLLACVLVSAMTAVALSMRDAELRA